MYSQIGHSVLISYYRVFGQSTNHVDGTLSSKEAGPHEHSVIEGWVHGKKYKSEG